MNDFYTPVSGEEEEYGICKHCMEAFNYDDLNEDTCEYCRLEKEFEENSNNDMLEPGFFYEQM